MNPPVHLTRHAFEAMKARDVSMQEILDIIENYTNRWEVSEHNGRPTPGRYVYQGQTLALVVVEKPHQFLVLTVLLKHPEQWDDAQARRRPRTALSEAG